MNPLLRIFASFTCLLSFALAKAQTLEAGYIATDGTVFSTAQKGDTLFIGGNFQNAGYSHKQLARFPFKTNDPEKVFPEFVGKISTMEPDGEGGFYICGRITNYNGRPINSLVIHINSDFSLDTSFKEIITNETEVIAYTARKKDNRLYICGSFQNVNNTFSPYLVVLNAQSGEYINWEHDVPSSAVQQIELTDSLLIIKGGVTNLGGYYIPGNFAAINLQTGKTVKDFPIVNQPVTTMTFDKTTLFLGGTFTEIGLNTTYLAKLPNGITIPDINFPNTDGFVNAIVQDKSGGYFIAGSFNHIGTHPVTNFAHLSANGKIDTSLNLHIDGSVGGLLFDNDTLYLFGMFSEVNGIQRNKIASIDLTTNELTNWNPAINGYVSTISLINNQIHIGGNFSQVNNTTRNYLAAITKNNEVTDWIPKCNGPVNQIVSNTTSTSIFLMGSFSRVGSQNHPYIAKVNATDGAAFPWRPAPDNQVNTILLKNNLLYIGGIFKNVSGQPRQYMAALDTLTDAPANILLDTDDWVFTLHEANEKLYIGGAFNTISGISRPNLAAINIANNSVDLWNPMPNDYVGSIYVSPFDSAIILCGGFSMISSTKRNYLASVDVKTKQITNWNPLIEWSSMYSIIDILHYKNETFIGGSFVYTNGGEYYEKILSVSDSSFKVNRTFQYAPFNENMKRLTVYDNMLFVCGDFEYVVERVTGRAKKAYYMIPFKLSNNKAVFETYRANGPVYDMKEDSNKGLLIAGTFSFVNAAPRNSLAAISLSSKTLLNWDAQLSGSNPIVNALAVKDSILYAGGFFRKVGTDARSNLAAINVRTAKATGWIMNANNAIRKLVLNDTTLYISGDFSKIGFLKRNYVAAASVKSNGTLTEWNPSPDYVVYAIVPVGDSIYLGGIFNTIKGVQQPYLAKTDARFGNLSPWKPDINGGVMSMTAGDNSLFIAGLFTKVQGKTRYSIASLNLSDHSLTTFVPHPIYGYPTYNGSIYSLVLWNNQLLIGSASMMSMNGIPSGRLASVDTATGEASNFNPQPDNAVQTISVSGNLLITGGEWNYLGNNISSSKLAFYSLPILQTPLQRSENKKSIEAVNNFTNNINSKGSSWNTVVSPNPSASNATLFVYGQLTNYSVQIRDITGKVIWQKTGISDQRLVLPVQEFATGLYFVTVSDGKNVQTSKFMVK
ncbi:T9SS type A sorting domain-containing protein [Limnovirga soli]|uniref:T9SS type A sorting domain-containing protein n=1 Tax=Limnovirga soli TaxID=2656915 RepID=A0A8J8FDJ4_9BACT|nr:T9SS type A sorting domain-containing protein [Limnovirga soli]NNV56085.1 T9SS type A sorting domain-containing protein [Limnovirga soli]